MRDGDCGEGSDHNLNLMCMMRDEGDTRAHAREPPGLARRPTIATSKSVLTVRSLMESGI